MKKKVFGTIRVDWSILTLIFMTLSLSFIISGCGDDSDKVTTPVPHGDGILYNVAGIATEPGGGGNGGPALAAYLYWPQDITASPTGEIYILDWNNHCARLVETNGTISRIIGSGRLGDDSSGPGDTIDLNHPTGLTIGPSGDFWLAAWHNWKVKRIDRTTWEVSAPIGTSQGFAGDGGPANQAKLDLPSSVVFDPAGNIYISDQGNQRIRKVDTQMIITTFAGGAKGYADGVGEDAQFSFPKGSDAGPGGKIALSPHEDFLYVADTENHRIRKIDLATAEVTTVAGTGTAGWSGDNGPALSAQLNYPTDVAVAEDHSIYVADSKNHVIRRIDPFGIITTVAGTGEPGFSPDGTPAKSAKLNLPSGVLFTDDGTLYIADTLNHQVKKVKNPDLAHEVHTH
ncbi:hypothetical protein IH992_27940 [Candidatus Poribacteria bacterium]|nr:hypothetical protein [Candidatus Poribacteria bacterium]